MLYIHIPFCKGKCIYCNFYSSGKNNFSEYIKALAKELSVRGNRLGKSLSSIYIGGGTPSLLPAPLFDSLITEIRRWLDHYGVKPLEDLEFTVEVNPEDVTEEKIKAWKNAGVNRISIGVQSLDDNELSLLRRRHDARRAMEAVRLLKRDFSNISVDLMYGIPGQTKESLGTSIDEVLDLDVQHVSLYALTYEPSTPMQILAEEGRFPVAEEELYNELGEFAAGKLRDAGFERYEISNYSLPGFRSRHNSGYWTGTPYLGIGPSASSYDGEKLRTTNIADINRYIRVWSDSDTTAEDLEALILRDELGEEELKTERLFLSLRTIEGLDLNNFAEAFGSDALAALLRKARPWLASGELRLTDPSISEKNLSTLNADSRLILTPSGIPRSDYIILSLL